VQTAGKFDVDAVPGEFVPEVTVVNVEGIEFLEEHATFGEVIFAEQGGLVGA
jgi:hypothetical protein